MINTCDEGNPGAHCMLTRGAASRAAEDQRALYEAFFGPGATDRVDGQAIASIPVVLTVSRAGVATTEETCDVSTYLIEGALSPVAQIKAYIRARYPELARLWVRYNTTKTGEFTFGCNVKFCE